MSKGINLTAEVDKQPIKTEDVKEAKAKAKDVKASEKVDEKVEPITPAAQPQEDGVSSKDQALIDALNRLASNKPETPNVVINQEPKKDSSVTGTGIVDQFVQSVAGQEWVVIKPSVMLKEYLGDRYDIMLNGKLFTFLIGKDNLVPKGTERFFREKFEAIAQFNTVGAFDGEDQSDIRNMD